MAKKKSTTSKKKDTSSEKQEEEKSNTVSASNASTEESKTSTQVEPAPTPKTQPEEEEEVSKSAFELISEDEGQTVRAMEVRGSGVMIQVETKKDIAMQWIPKVHLEENEDNPGCCKVVMGF